MSLYGHDLRGVLSKTNLDVMPEQGGLHLKTKPRVSVALGQVNILIFLHLSHQMAFWHQAGRVAVEFLSFDVSMHCIDGQITLASDSASVLKDRFKFAFLD